MSPAIRILGRQKPITVEDGSTLLDALVAAGFSVAADCGGKGKCGRCKVKVHKGASRLPLAKAETKRLGDAEAARGLRLACQHAAVDGLVLEVVEESYRQEVYKRLGIGLGRPLPSSPSIRMVPLPGGEIESALAAVGLLKDVDWPAVLPDAGRCQPPAGERPAVSAGLPPSCCSALVTEFNRVIGLVAPSFAPHGIAVDLGTSTIAVYLGNLQTGEVLGIESARNPQISFGADVMSRITACRDPKSAETMKEMARGTISACIRTLARRYDLPQESLVDALVVGNSTMIHILLGAPVHGLGVAPYRPLFHESLKVRAPEIGFPLHAGACVQTLPLPAAFVGADTMAAWLWVERTMDEGPTLLLDLGTNGEMVLSANGRLWATSCATGPAFEGATLSCGMAGIPGAIEKVSFLDGALELKVIGDSTDPAIRPQGLCGSGAMSALAALLARGIIRPDGRFEPNLHHESLRRMPTGVEFILASAKQAANGRPIVMRQKDVRELQLAKGAVATGIKFLCKAAGIRAPARILLAGAFGNVIAPEDAITIGMVPRIDAGRIAGIGNAAGLGAALALLDIRGRRRAEALLHEMEVVEMGGAPGFREAFFASLAFPERRQADQEL
ncbi:MAG: ASKHA domain-containing protein [Desulfobaccales bacterium]